MKKTVAMRIFKGVFIILILAFFIQAMLLFFSDETAGITGDKIVTLELSGVILDSSGFIRKIKKFEENPNVKGYIIKINSPGGGVAPSQEIYRYLRKLKKPVYASMSSMAASGGYYVAAACDKIYALPGTITGSIGVIMKFTNMKELYSKIGIKSETIKSGLYKDIGSPDREMTAAEKKLLQASITDVYNQFVGDIVKGRNIKKATLKKYADGRIITGNQAQKIGLVDSLGTHYEAFIDMKKSLKLKDVELYEYKHKMGFLDKLVQESKWLGGKIKTTSGFFYLFEM